MNAQLVLNAIIICTHTYIHSYTHQGTTGDGGRHQLISGRLKCMYYHMYTHTHIYTYIHTRINAQQVMGDAIGSFLVILNACIIKYCDSWGEARFLSDPITSLIMCVILLVQTIPLSKCCQCCMCIYIYIHTSQT
jgi:Co/Zn/Cd efflux system component